MRPALVIADPDADGRGPAARLAASAMNALAHAMEALYTPLANPVSEMAALRAAALFAGGVTQDPPDREALALGALLAGYASGATGSPCTTRSARRSCAPRAPRTPRPTR